MQKELNFRKAELWEKKDSREIWMSFRAHIDASVSGLFPADRKRAFVAVKNAPTNTRSLDA